jgi:hypothetical protein
MWVLRETALGIAPAQAAPQKRDHGGGPRFRLPTSAPIEQVSGSTFRVCAQMAGGSSPAVWHAEEDVAILVGTVQNLP